MIAAIFVLKLCAGITLMWWLMPRRQVTDGFFRIQMRLLLGLAVLAALLLTSLSDARLPSATGAVSSGDVPVVASPVDARPADARQQTEANATLAGTGETEMRVAVQNRWLRNANICLCVVAYLGSVFWALGRRSPGNVCIYLCLLIATGGLLYFSWNSSAASLVIRLLNVSTSFVAAVVAGSMLTGMLLGHWYLTTPTMSIQPLFWFQKTIFVAAILRGILLLISVLCFKQSASYVWLSMTFAGAVLTPLVVVWMVRRILVHRNTQSATGVLFAGLILVFMGEMTAILSQQATAIPN